MDINDSIFKFIPPSTPARQGQVTVKKVYMEGICAWKLKQRFITLDVKTTGYSPQYDRIIELGAVLFENRQPVSRFSTLVDPGFRISPSMTNQTGISNSMLRYAPDKMTAFAELATFMDQVLGGKSLLVTHNAKFACEFLSNSLARMGYDAVIRSVDTLVLSQIYLPELPDHRLKTVADHFSIKTTSTRRAIDNAEICGQIMVSLIDLLQ